jgi:hypothetical protein
VYYTVLDYAAVTGLATRVLFVHVPIPAPALSKPPALVRHDVSEKQSLEYLDQVVCELIGELAFCTR